MTVATNLILLAILQKIAMKFSDNYQELTFFQSYDENGKHNIISTLQSSNVIMYETKDPYDSIVFLSQY